MIFRKVIVAFLLPFNILLLLYIAFENRLSVPLWLRVFGRMHPLIVHFPIVLIFLYAALIFFIPKTIRQEKWYRTMTEVLLLTAAFTAVVTALMGLFLSKEEGYDPDSLTLHKWAGVATAFGLFLLYGFHKKLQSFSYINYFAVLLVVVFVVSAGHLGGNITHGDNFVLAPVTPQNKKIRANFDEAYVYADMVQPILENKCMSCHNNSKAKGGLILETRQLLLKGGKDGKLWDSTKADLGLLMQRIHLPEEEKEHMPPAGKPQLTNMELEILYQWVKTGANFEQKVSGLFPADTLRVLASKVLKTSADEFYDFPAAAENDIKKLGSDNRVITPVFINSPALDVSFYNRGFYSSEKLAELKPLSKQIVDLNLEHMAVKDEDLKIIAEFTNLRELNLNFTSITGSTLGSLTKLVNLRTLSLVGTTIKQNQLNVLIPMQKLRTIFLWNTSITVSEIQKLQAKNKNISYRLGYNGDTVKIKLTPPISENDTQVIVGPTPVKLKYYMKGITIRYTLDGAEPDSLFSPIYQNNLQVDSTIVVKAKAFKPGWITSDDLELNFYKATYRPDKITLLNPPDLKYKGDGGKILFDLDKSDFNFGNGKWQAYQLNPMDAVFYFEKPVLMKSVMVSMMTNFTAFIFPPSSLEVLGGTEEKNLKPLYSFNPVQPLKDDKKSSSLFIVCRFKPTKIRYLRLVMKPIARLPKWLKPTKKDKAWIFMDEIMLN